MKTLLYNGVMKLPCYNAQNLLPAIRALIAKNLIEKYNFTQQGVAKKLGVTQSAVSQYMRNVRGLKFKSIESDEIISKEIENFTGRIASGELNSDTILNHLCKICKKTRKRELIKKI